LNLNARIRLAMLPAFGRFLFCPNFIPYKLREFLPQVWVSMV